MLKTSDVSGREIERHGSEKEEVFCDEHGHEYAVRGHLVISENM
jgi:hypothetical protein